MIELESLEPRMQIAYKHGEIPAALVADLSLARLMVTELDLLLRHGLDASIGDTGEYHAVYTDATYDRQQLTQANTTPAGDTT
ncbi:MAG TPA: hypothetical protein VMS99_10140 [Acidimicrobiia bacterium]|nr:hypothetical protein [Acidimicrobiia bacterium]